MTDELNIKTLKEAMMSSEFPNFFKKGLKTLLLKAYNESPRLYEKCVHFETSDRDKEEYPALGAAPEPTKVLQGQEFPHFGLLNEFITITNYKYGEIMEIARELIEDEQTRQLKNIPSMLGQAHARFENNTVFTFYNNGATATAYDAQNYFDTAGHPDITGGAAVAVNTNSGALGQISEANLETALAEIRLWRGRQGEHIVVFPKVLLVAPSEEFVSRRLMKSGYEVGSNLGHITNIHEGSMEVIVSPWLTTQTWYILTDIPGLVYQWRQKLDLLQEDIASGSSFDTDVYRYRSLVRFGLDATDWRFGYKGN